MYIGATNKINDYDRKILIPIPTKDHKVKQKLELVDLYISN